MRFVDDEQRLAAVLVVAGPLTAAAAGREETAREHAVAGRRRLGRRARSARRRPRSRALAPRRRQVEAEPSRVGARVLAAVVVRLQVVGAEAAAQETDARREVLAPARQRHLADRPAALTDPPKQHTHE